MNKDIAFQAINIYPRKYDIMCIYIRNILCIYWDCKLEERESRPPCTINEGGVIDEQEEEIERSIDRR
jgi:hypothetical protein